MSASPELDERIRLLPVHRGNWEAISSLEVDGGQSRLLPTNTYALLQAHYEGQTPYAVYYGTQPVGLIIVAEASGVYWVSHIMIARDHQQRGVGHLALEQLLETLRTRPHATEVRTSVANANAVAEHFFTTLGFERSGYQDNKEFIMTKPLA